MIMKSRHAFGFKLTPLFFVNISIFKHQTAGYLAEVS